MREAQGLWCHTGCSTPLLWTASTLCWNGVLWLGGKEELQQSLLSVFLQGAVRGKVTCSLNVVEANYFLQDVTQSRKQYCGFWHSGQEWAYGSIGLWFLGLRHGRYVLCLVLEGDMNAKDLQSNCLILNTCWPQYIAGLRLLHQVPGKTEMQKLLMLWFKLTNVVIAS